VPIEAVGGKELTAILTAASTTLAEREAPTDTALAEREAPTDTALAEREAPTDTSAA
jgi:hypothetical protein